jgi:hypothetical protein
LAKRTPPRNKKQKIRNPYGKSNLGGRDFQSDMVLHESEGINNIRKGKDKVIKTILTKKDNIVTSIHVSCV